MTADLGGAIAGIYDTVHSDAHWPAALDGLAAGVGSRGAILVGGALVACNRELNRIFDLKDGIALSRTGRLECGNTGKSAELGGGHCGGCGHIRRRGANRGASRLRRASQREASISH